MNVKNNPSLKRLAASLPNKPLIVFAPTNAVFSALRKAAASKAEADQPIRPYLNFSSYCTTPSCIIVGPAVGSPAAILVLEPFLQQNGVRLGFLGTCGGLLHQDSEIEIGDIVNPTGALSEEGTSQHYGGSSQIDFQHHELQQRLMLLLEKPGGSSHTAGKIRSGRIWTTDVPYLEHQDKVEHYLSMGAVGVDMEFSAVLQLAEYYGVPYISALVVSDLVSTNPKSGFRSPQLMQSITAAAEAFIDLSLLFGEPC